MSHRKPTVRERAAAAVPYLFVSLAVLVLDQWSKWLVEAHLPAHVAQPVIPGFLNFTHVQNTGVAFGMFAQAGRDGGVWLLTALGLLALVLVVVYFWHTPQQNRLLRAALALVLGGAVGNLVDRVSAGAVTDFIDVFVGSYHWHTFNVADSAISIGIVLIAWDSLRASRRRPEEGEAPGEGTADETTREAPSGDGAAGAR